MSNNNNNNNNFVRADGSVNCDNPRVCAAMVDGIGILLTHVINGLREGGIIDQLDDKTRVDLECVYKTLQLVRNNLGVDTDWYHENQHDLVAEIYAEAHRVRKMRQDDIVKALLAAGMPIDLLPPEMRPKPSASDSADALLDSLRADGVIG